MPVEPTSYISMSRQVVDATLDSTPITVDCSVLPGNGNLIILPYTGATTGCSKSFAPLKQKLSFDAVHCPICLAEKIDVAVALSLQQKALYRGLTAPSVGWGSDSAVKGIRATRSH
jgi:hypothetical protein